MMRWVSGLLQVALLAFASVEVFAQPQELTVGERYDALIQAIDSDVGATQKARADALGRIYDDLFPAETFHALGQADDQSLSLALLAAANAVRLVGHPSYVRQAELAFGELQRRKVTSAKQVSYMQGVYVQMRMLDEARRFQMQHPSIGLERIPPIREAERLQSDQPTALVVSQDGAALFRNSVDLSSGTKIIVVAHPRCGYSRRAMLAIEADAILSNAFATSATWMTPPDLRLEVDAIQRWNKEHPAVPLGLAYHFEEWPQLDYWGTPTFYFFQDGELEAKVTGWPKGGRREELLAALDKVGLLSPGE